MTRTDRMFDLARSLATPEGRSVRELAVEFQASERTIFRDLAALEAHDLRVERLEGGRYRVESNRLRPALDSSELAIVQVALTAAAPSTRGPIARRLRRLVAKLDHALSGRLDDRRTPVNGQQIRRDLERLISYRRTASLLYRSLAGDDYRLRVDPWRLIERAGSGYLAGRCHANDELRLFRLERIRAVHDEGQRRVEPGELDLDRLAEPDAQPAEATG